MAFKTQQIAPHMAIDASFCQLKPPVPLAKDIAHHFELGV